MRPTGILNAQLRVWQWEKKSNKETSFTRWSVTSSQIGLVHWHHHQTQSKSNLILRWIQLYRSQRWFSLNWFSIINIHECDDLWSQLPWIWMWILSLIRQCLWIRLDRFMHSYPHCHNQAIYWHLYLARDTGLHRSQGECLANGNWSLTRQTCFTGAAPLVTHTKQEILSKHTKKVHLRK
jgi:hypothetical protein